MKQIASKPFLISSIIILLFAWNAILSVLYHQEHTLLLSTKKTVSGHTSEIIKLSNKTDTTVFEPRPIVVTNTNY